MKNILIVGYNGYVGSIVVKHLKKKNFYLYGLDTHWFSKKVINDSINFDYLHPDVIISKDIRKFKLSKLKIVPYAIVYLAAVSNDPMGKKYIKATHDINTKACIDLAISAKRIGVKKFIFASSCSIYGASGNKKKRENNKLQPLTHYAESKINSEKYLKKLSSNKFRVVSLRFATAAGYSPKLRLDLVFNDFIVSALTLNKIVILSDGQAWRPLIEVGDMARSIEWAINYKNNNKFIAVNVGSNKWTFRIKDLAKKIAKIIKNVKVSLNKNNPADKRSYTVDFSLYKKIAKNYQPKANIKKSVKIMIEKLEKSNLKFKNFRKSKDFIRLNTLTELQEEKKLDKNLFWLNDRRN